MFRKGRRRLRHDARQSSRSTRVPSDGQFEQAPERPAADPRLLGVLEPQTLQARENAGQSHVRDYRARGEGAGAIMRAGAEGDALLGVAGDVEAIGLSKAALVAIGGAEHE